MIITETILGKVPSKSNCYKVGTISGHGTIIKQDALKKYEKDFYLQCKSRGAMIKGFFKARIDIFHENMRPDLDNGFKVILDCLQACKVIKNDNQCVEINARKLIDKNNPRAELTIETVDL